MQLMDGFMHTVKPRSRHINGASGQISLRGTLQVFMTGEALQDRWRAATRPCVDGSVIFLPDERRCPHLVVLHGHEIIARLCPKTARV